MSIIGGIIAGIVLLVVMTFIGICLWAASDLPLALRELAINSRQGKIRGSAYALLKILALMLKIWAVIIWVLGLIISFMLAAFIINPSLMAALFIAS